MRAWARIPLQLATLGLLLFIAAAAVVTGAYYYVEPSLPTADELRAVQFQTPLRVNSRDGQLITQYGEEKRLIAEFEDIPQSVKNAIVAAEDDRFYQHSGIDLVSTLRAILNYGLSLVTGSGERVAGGSTITQQVPRTMELISRDYGVGRKVAEIFLAFRIEREFTKDEILGLYLNTYFFGQSSFGVVQAARTYFNKDLSDLTLSEVAIIAGIPTAPSVNNPYNSPANAERRRAYVLRRMEELDYIDAAERQQALAEPIISQKFGVELELDAGYIGDMAIGFCQARFGDRACREDGLVIYTTVESRAQRAGNAALRGALDAYDRNHGYRGPLGHFDLASIGLGEVVPASGDGPGVDRSPDPSNESGEAASSRVAFDPGSTEVLNTLLGDFPDRFEAEAGLVLSVDETQAEVYLRSAGVVQVGLDAVSWAAPYINDDRSGTAPDFVSDVLAPGDIVRWQRNSAGLLELAQVPELSGLINGIDTFVEGALVSLDPMDGAVIALTGGYDFQHTPFNRATQAKRQPGSSFKPFFYLSALDNGYTLSTVINDAPETYYDETLERMQTVKNYEGTYNGPTRLRNVLIKSLNASADRVIRDIGASTVANYVERFGFNPERRERNASLALGSLAVTPLEMAAAYTVLANGGYAVGIANPDDGKVRPYFIERVENAVGEVLYDASLSVRRVCPDLEDEDLLARLNDERLIAYQGEVFPRLRCAEQVESPQRIFLITDVLKGVIQSGSGRRARDAFPGRLDLAGKTGTTTGPRDAWFAGFNADLVAIARVGFDEDARDLGAGEQGGRTAIPAWIDYMRVMIDGQPEHALPRPPGIDERRINPETGLLAADCARNTIWEYFEVGRLPEKESSAACFTGNTGSGSESSGGPGSGSGSDSLFE